MKYVPGVMHCAKCKFRLVRTNFHTVDGAITAGDNQTEPCPNGCGPLWPVTWEQEARECWERLEALTQQPAPVAGFPVSVKLGDKARPLTGNDMSAVLAKAANCRITTGGTEMTDTDDTCPKYRLHLGMYTDGGGAAFYLTIAAEEDPDETGLGKAIAKGMGARYYFAEKLPEAP